MSAERLVSMGHVAVTADPAEALLAIGLGSCIGLALVDAGRGVAGLAHIMLPASWAGGRDSAGADRAVPLLLERVLELGARRWALQAAIAGGAQMFAELGDAPAIGGRNETATRAALRRARIAVDAAATGGPIGRTMRVDPSSGRVTVREVGGTEEVLLAALDPITPRR